MSTTVIENKTTEVVAPKKESKNEINHSKSSPWEILDHQPGALKMKGGNKLLTIEDALKNTGQNGSVSKTSISNFKHLNPDSVLVKKESEEQWNPVDLSHLLITDAPPKIEKGSDGRFKNGSTRRKSANLKGDKSKLGSKKNSKDKSLHSENKKNNENNEHRNQNNLSRSSFRKHENNLKKTKVDMDTVKQFAIKNKDVSFENEKQVTDGTENLSVTSTEHTDNISLKGALSSAPVNSDFQKLSPHYKGKKPFHEGFTANQRKPYHSKHKINNQSFDQNNVHNKIPYEKRSHHPRAYNTRYNSSYQNRTFNHYNQQPIILPIYQKQFPSTVYYDCAKQLAYYLSQDNLKKDEFLVKNLMDKTGYVQLSQLLNFKKLKQLTQNGNFEIVMTALFIILAQQLDQTEDIEVALLDSVSEYVATDIYGNKNPYDCYILKNVKWENEDTETNPRVFNAVTVFSANDFISYSIQIPETNEKN
ncbi:hypothetical protein QEN19_002934 [Hanseniaspora menglaensis]